MEIKLLQKLSHAKDHLTNRGLAPLKFSDEEVAELAPFADLVMKQAPVELKLRVLQQLKATDASEASSHVAREYFLAKVKGDEAILEALEPELAERAYPLIGRDTKPQYYASSDAHTLSYLLKDLIRHHELDAAKALISWIEEKDDALKAAWQKSLGEQAGYDGLYETAIIAKEPKFAEEMLALESATSLGAREIIKELSDGWTEPEMGFAKLAAAVSRLKSEKAITANDQEAINEGYQSIFYHALRNGKNDIAIKALKELDLWPLESARKGGNQAGLDALAKFLTTRDDYNDFVNTVIMSGNIDSVKMLESLRVSIDWGKVKAPPLSLVSPEVQQAIQLAMNPALNLNASRDRGMIFYLDYLQQHAPEAVLSFVDQAHGLVLGDMLLSGRTELVDRMLGLIRQLPDDKRISILQEWAKGIPGLATSTMLMSFVEDMAARNNLDMKDLGIDPVKMAENMSKCGMYLRKHIEEQPDINFRGSYMEGARMLMAAMPMPFIQQHLHDSFDPELKAQWAKQGLPAMNISEATLATDKEYFKRALFMFGPSSYGFKPELYEQILPHMTAIAEKEHTWGAQGMAAKLCILCESATKADHFLQRMRPAHSEQPVHDSLLFDLPTEGGWDISAWRRLLLKHNRDAGIKQLITRAPQIEQMFDKEYPGLSGEARREKLENLSVEQLRDYNSRYRFGRHEENPALGEFCLSLPATERGFNESLEIMGRNKPEKNTPPLHIDGKDIGRPGYTLETVPPSDPLCLWIGKIVNCCNHLEGATRNNAIAHVTSPDAALYVVRDPTGTPVAKVTGWISEKGKLVFNSWERKAAQALETDKVCEPFLLAAAIQAVKTYNVPGVFIGRNRADLELEKVERPEPPRDKRIAWYDAQQQHLLADKKHLKDAERRLKAAMEKKGRAPTEPRPDGFIANLAQGAGRISPWL